MQWTCFFFNRVHLSLQLHHNGKSKALRQSTSTMHFRKQNDDFKETPNMGKPPNMVFCITLIV